MKNLFTSILSLLFLCLLLETVVFKFIFPATDMPEPEFIDGVIKYKSNQQGVYRVKDEINARYRINANGWNSRYEKYVIKNTQEKYRIAVIGDSFVEALQVDYDSSLAEQLENKLGNDSFQVYRFGISGAPMS